MPPLRPDWLAAGEEEDVEEDDIEMDAGAGP